MCGQFGIMTGNSAMHTADDFLADAFVTSMLRGVDSSGIANIDIKKNDYLIQKLPVAGLHFVGDTVAKRLMRYGTAIQNISMGHVRAATVGQVSMATAHPFAIERDNFDLVGTHNGTLTGWANKPTARYYDVDSEWALSRIAADGLEAFKEFNGAYSFVWWQGDDPNVLQMARNKERPMSVAFLRNGGMAYASEPGMLYWLLERNSAHIDGQILVLDEGKHYKFNALAPKEFESEELPKAVVTTYGTSTYSRNTSTTYSTTVDDVKRLIAKVKAGQPADLEAQGTLAYDYPLAYESEIKKARDYGWFDVKAEFTPMEVDSAGNTKGIVEIDGAEFDAFVRGDYTNTYSFNDIWIVSILGVQDDDKDLTMVLSRPSKTISTQQLLEEL